MAARALFMVAAASPRLVPVLLLCLFGGSVALWLMLLQPAQGRLERAREQAAAQHAAQARRAVATAGQAAWRRRFGPEQRFPDALAQVAASAAGCGLRLDEGAYRVTRETAGPLARYQVTLPVRGEYPQLRCYLSALPGAWPALALDNLQLERAQVGDAALDARIRLVLFLERAR